MYELLSLLSAWSVVIPLFAGLWGFRRLESDSQLIFALVLIATIPQMIHVFNPKSRIEIISYNAYTIAEFIIYYALFHSKINRKSYKKCLEIMLFIYVCEATLFIWQHQIDSRFLNELAVSNGIFCLITIGLYLLYTLINDTGDLQTARPFFWFTAGILMYAACTTLVYSLWQRILNNPDTIMESLWNLQNVFNITTYILFTVGLGKNVRRPTTAELKTN